MLPGMGLQETTLGFGNMGAGRSPERRIHFKLLIINNLNKFLRSDGGMDVFLEPRNVKKANSNGQGPKGLFNAGSDSRSRRVDLFQQGF